MVNDDNMRRRIDDLLANPKELADQLIRAFESTERQIEESVKRGQERVAAVDAQELPNRLVIRMNAKRGRVAYVTSVSYKAGDGYKVGKFALGSREKAMNFSAGMGLAIARQLAASYIGVTMEKA